MSTSPLHLKPWHLLLAIALTLTAGLGLSLRAEVAAQAVSFGYGIHLVDPQGLNRMPVWINKTESPVDYTLYPLSAPDFLRRYAADPYFTVLGLVDVIRSSGELESSYSYSVTPDYLVGM